MSEDINAIVISHKPLTEHIIKRLLLIFDQVHLVDPEFNNVLIPGDVTTINYGPLEITMSSYGMFYKREVYQDQEVRLINQFDYAVKKGILRIENLRAIKFFERNWLPLRLSYDFDTANPQILEAAKGLIENDPKYVPGTGILRGFFIQPQGIKIYPDIPKAPDVFEGDQKDISELQAFSAIGKLNRDLMLAEELQLIPTFVNQSMASLFAKKVEAAKSNQDLDVIRTFQQIHNMELKNVQYLLYNISQLILPDEILQQIPVKELIIARNNTFHELYKLRRNLLRSIKFLTNNQFDEQFLSQVQEFISYELRPQIEDYNSKFVNIMTKFIGYESTFVFSAIGTGIGLVQNLDPFSIAALSGISAVVGSAVSNLANYIANKGKEEFNNTYSYLLNFKN